MGGYFISVCRISIHATESHIELIGSAFSATLGLKLKFNIKRCNSYEYLIKYQRYSTLGKVDTH